jgi:hypothetical protein
MKRMNMRGFLKNAGLLGLSVIIALVMLEGLSRLVYPVQYGHKSFDLDGNPIYPATDFLGVVPNLTYRQKAQEFDKITTHTAGGYRGPADSFMDVPNPEILFLGDSMTYGVGLADEETIPYLYCKAAGKTCANLGRPGAGTREEIDILQNRLEKDGWRPLEVKLLMNVMTAAQFGGNDLTDNLAAAQRQVEDNIRRATIARGENPAAAETETATPTLRNFLSLPAETDILSTSNLARVGYYIFAPMLRRWFAPEMDATLLKQALSLTQDDLARLEMLSQRYAFRYRLYIVHPMQDITRGTWMQTRNDINAIAPHGAVVDTAPALIHDNKNPADYYYALDGHVRPDGAAKIAAYMLDND